MRIDKNYKPTFTIRRTPALNELSKEQLVNLLPPMIQAEIERIEETFANIDSIADKILVNPASGERIQGKILTKDEVLLLFDPDYIQIEGLSKEDNDLVYIASDPVLWCRVYLKMNPKLPQILILREQRPRTVLRWGRRLGKSTTMAIRMLWRSFTRPQNKTLLVAPMLAHVDVTWEMLVELLQNDEEFKELYDSKKIANRKQPHHMMTFPNGSTIKAFTSGMRSNNNADSIRGQEGDDLYCDEIDYMNAGDLKALMAIVRKTPNSGKKYMVVSSTPSGRRDMMYRFSSEFVKKHPELYREYYFPTHCDIFYNEAQDDEFKMVYTHNQYLHEIIADFGEEASGVFLQSHIERACSHVVGGYKYERSGFLYKAPGTKRVVGVDWDKFGAGVNIIITDFNIWSDFDEKDIDAGRCRILARFEVPRGDYTLNEGKELIKRIFLTYNPDIIVLDRGYGEDQYEDLSLAGINEKAYAGMQDIIRPFYFHQSVEIWDPMTRQTVKKEAKDYMVSQAVKLFENDQIILNKRDKEEVPGLTDLIAQFESYIVVGMSVYGKPRYEAGSPDIGDHALDAFMLTVIGAVQEWGDFSTMRKTPRPVAVSFDPRKSTGYLVDTNKDIDVEDISDIKYLRRTLWKNRGRLDNSRKRAIKRTSF